ncbi:MAG: MtrB/PioB family decaheme-associated outer membrane protein [Deltaproteobacteria bacterium]|nr:MtrB/PioB family decaheme-associated outer membrane protein [Deltaproteobacteria bacterium]
MRRRYTTLLQLAGFVIALVGAPGAWAQTELFGLRLSSETEVGGRVFIDRPAKRDRGKFEEYGDVPGGIFLENLRLGLDSKDDRYSLEIRARNAGVNNQNFQLRSSRIGRYAFEFEWDQTPHLFSTTARLLGSRPTPDVFTLVSPRPALSAHNAGSELDTLALRWDTARIATTLTPTPELDFTPEYTRVNKHGDRPIGMAFGSPGSNFREILEPIEQDVHNVRLALSTVKPSYRLQFGYHLSLFENAFTSVTSDNPSVATDTAAAGGSRGRTALAPDNSAHTLSLAGGVNLPLRTRLNANVAYGMRFQNQSFIPHTINSAIPSSGLTLPQSSLNGDVRTWLVNLSATSRLLDPVLLTAKYRFYRYDDQSDEIHFPERVLNDRTLETEERLANRFPYDKHNASVDGRWQIWTPLAFSAGVGWERWDRSKHRETGVTDEVMPKATLDYTPTDWLLLRGTYAPSVRTNNGYNALAHLEHVVEEDPVAFAASQHLLGRKFDEARRERQRVDLLSQFTPLDNLSAGLTYSLRHDKYPGSFFGLTKDRNWAAGVDVNWAATKWLSFLVSYVREEIKAEQRSRYREPPAQLENDTFDWISRTNDLMDTVTAGVSATVLPRRLDVGSNWSFQHARSKITAFNPTTPSGGTAAQRTSATAQNFPTIRDALSRLETFVRYRLGDRWTTKLAYSFELFRKTDFRTDDLAQSVGSDIFLGNDLRDYTTHIFTFVLGYRF